MKFRLIAILFHFILLIGCRSGKNKIHSDNEGKVVPAMSGDGVKAYKNNSYTTDLLQELERPQKKVKLLQRKYKELGIEIRYPFFNVAEFDDIIESDITRSLKIKYCGKKQTVQIDYEVGTATDNMVSILKRVSVLHCSPSDFLYLGKVNVIRFGKQTFVINLSKKYYNYLEANKWKIFKFNDYDGVVPEDVTLSKNLIFKNKKALICNILNAKSLIDEEYQIATIDTCFTFSELNKENGRLTNESL